MANVTVNFEQMLGKIKPMHAVGQPPIAGGFRKLDFPYIRFLQEANIPYSRLHDVGGAYGGGRYVDIPNLFRDFEADETDPANYDFTFTDALLEGLAEYEVKPIFRLGVTIENQFNIKAYHIYPPKDYAKWARICEHVIRHYNEGWADGFHYGIKYWEIWNEPDNGVPGENQMWLGTNEEYYELYHVAATHLKACFGDKIKVGGYGACSPRGIFYEPEKYGVRWEKVEPSHTGIHRLEFLFGFLDYIKTHNSPIDFFSWHSYANVEMTLEMSKFFRRTLDQYGYEGLETMLNEWNGPHAEIQHDTSYASAQVAAMMLTASPHIVTDVVLKKNGIWDYFEEVWSVEDFGLSKGTAPIYHRVAERIGCSTADLDFYDDNPLALMGGKAAGCRIHAVRDRQTEEELSVVQQLADCYIESYRELLN